MGNTPDNLNPVRGKECCNDETKKKAAKKTKGSGRTMPPYSIEFRLKMARLHAEDGHSTGLIADQFSIIAYSVLRRSRQYQLYGQKGLENQPRKNAGSISDAPIAKAIINLIKQNPAHGARRISDILK